MRVKIGAVVTPANDQVHGLAVGDQYVVIGYAREGGYWVQRIDDGQLPVNVKVKRQKAYPYGFGEIVCGYTPKELQVVGQAAYGLAA